MIRNKIHFEEGLEHNNKFSVNFLTFWRKFRVKSGKNYQDNSVRQQETKSEHTIKENNAQQSFLNFFYRHFRVYQGAPKLSKLGLNESL